MRFEEILVILTAITGIICLVNFAYYKWRKQSIKGKKQNWVIEYSKSFFPVLILVLCLRSFLIEPFRIPTGSMKPTLLEGDFILVNKFQYGIRLPILGTTLVNISAPKVGDIVVFRHHEDGKDLIKRVIGVPGDRVQYIAKQLYINGQLVPTEEIGSTHDRGVFAIESRENLDPITHNIYIYPKVSAIYPYNDVIVPPNSYFVMGDNRDNSLDGRYLGFVSDKDLLGKAVATWMSWDSDGTSSIVPIRWSRIGKSVYTYSDKNA